MLQRKWVPPAASEAKPNSGRARAEFYAPPDHKPGANVWVGFALADGKATVTLERDYDDLKPAPGWHVEVADKLYEVQAVSGRALTCVELPN